MKRVFIVSAIFFTSVLAMGCNDGGPLEKAGQRADDFIDDAKNGEINLKADGPMEKAGKSIDRAMDKVENATK